MVPLLAIREEVPSRRWLAVHYGVAAAMGLSAVVMPWEGSPKHVELLYGAAMVALGIRDIRRFSRAGTWPRMFDVAFKAALVGVLAVLAAAAAVVGNVLLAPVSTGGQPFPFDVSILAHTTFGLATAAPFAVAMLAETVHTLLVASATIIGTALIYVEGPRLAA